MGNNHPADESRQIIICVDSYENANPTGRLWGGFTDPEAFQSLTQFLLNMQALLDALQMPQADTVPRRFHYLQERSHAAPPVCHPCRGRRATFRLQVRFRQHSSWQGTLTWLEEGLEHSFRSVLELVLLMDNALRSREGCDCA